MIDILIVIPELYSIKYNYGQGAAKVALKLEKGLNKLGYKADIYSLKNNEIYNFKKLFLYQFYLILINTIKLIKIIKKNKIEAILAQDNLAALISLIGRNICFKKIPVIITVHATLSERWKHYCLIKKYLVKKTSQLLYKHVDQVITVSYGALDDLKMLFPGLDSKLECIYNPVIDEDIINLSLKDDIDGDIDRDNFILGVGRLSYQKGFDILIRAFKLVQNRLNTKLIIIGEGPERDSLSKLINDLKLENRVKLIGYKENPYSYIRRANIFILSSRWEGLPTVLIEALPIARRIIATNCKSGPFEILEGGKWGTLVDPENAEKLASAIVKVISKEESKMPEYVWRRFDILEVAKRYQDIILRQKKST